LSASFALASVEPTVLPARTMVLPLTAGFFFGLLLGSFVPYLPLSIVLILLAVASALTYLEQRGTLSRQHGLLVYGSIVIGLFYWSFDAALTAHGPLPYVGSRDPVILEGTICEPVRHGPNRAAVVLCVAESKHHVGASESHGRVRLTWREPDQSLLQGETVSVTTRIRAPSGMVNPGGFDYGAYLERQGIDAVASVSGPGRVTRQPFTSYDPRWMVWRTIDEWRDRIRQAATASLHDAALGLYLGMIIGEPDYISPEIRDLFMATGTVHILSISGSHLGLIAVASFFLIRRGCRLLPPTWLLSLSRYTTPTRLAALLTVPPVVFYTLLAGAQLATIRSLVMILLFLLAVWMGRNSNILITLAVAAWLILLHDPKALFDISFQLSFLSVLAIALVLQRIGQEHGADDEDECVPSSLIDRFRNWLQSYCWMTGGVTLVTLPVVAYYFNQIPWVGLIGNLVIVPIAGFVLVPVGLASAIWYLIAGSETLPASHINQTIGDVLFGLVETLAHMPHAEWHVASPSLPAIVVFYLFLVIAMWPPRGIVWLKRGSAAMVMFILIWWMWSPRPWSDGETLRVTFLDVGQGDACLVELPNQKTILIDGGATYETLDIGRAVIAPYLWDRGISHIDHVIGTHPQLDHIGGLAWTVRQFDVGRYWHNGTSRNEAFYVRLQDKLHAYRVPEQIAEEGQMVVDTGPCRLRVLNPPVANTTVLTTGKFNSGSALNNRSIVTRLDCGPHSFLFTADIEASTIARLQHDPWFSARVIKVPHHGGNSSLHEGWIASVPPEVAVISVGRVNSYGHPTEQVLDAYERQSVRVLRTDRDGAIQIVAKLSSSDLTIRSARGELMQPVILGPSMFAGEQDNLMKLRQQWDAL
ncbi:MAG TPA: DNA internalization-related competence protein ComEC/Rec2, partial [Nitrospiraceae bacterium]|nr:DNA internalization-related competence protein ComEC/Rec2 [Nitrospiraceae bacterium]